MVIVAPCVGGFAACIGYGLLRSNGAPACAGATVLGIRIGKTYPPRKQSKAKHKNHIRPAIQPIRVPPPRIRVLARAQQDFQRTIDDIDTY
jgi:hypothetical protein